jgi:hypothetical protein
MVTKERFAQGMTFQQYLDQMGTNKERFEDWCGDARCASSSATRTRT